MPIIKKIPVFKDFQTERKRVAAYARVSVEEERTLHSLSAQISHYSRLIQGNPAWSYAGVYADNGISGTSTENRTEFRKLMKDCDDGKIDIVLTKSVSRFARDTVDCLNAIRHLKSIGVEVRFERESISTFDKDGEFLLTILASFAQAESESVSQNIKWAIRKQFKKGIPNGHKAPYGYQWDGERFRIIPEQGKIVKEIYRRYLAGESGYSIAKALKERGVPGQSGESMCDSTIKDIVSSESYTGTMILQKNYFTESHTRKRNKGELPRYAVDGIFEPLVSRKDFEEAQRLRKERADGMPCLHPQPTQYSGKIKCGHCGCGISRRRGRRWICNNRERKGVATCDVRPLAEKELEEAINKAAFQNMVREILVFNSHIEIHTSDGKPITVRREFDGRHKRRCFSGKVFCGECGGKLGRDTWRKSNGDKVESWGCMTTPRNLCSLKAIKEKELLNAATIALSAEDVEPFFVEHVEKAVVYNDRIEFIRKDGMIKICQR